jgi:hypothetical protein
MQGKPDTGQVSKNWFLVHNHSFHSLGQAELLQSGSESKSYKATIFLNSYESNCIRDWLSLRWTAVALQNTCVFEGSQSQLKISLLLAADSLPAAKVAFQHWLNQVAGAREAALQCRR